MYALPFGTLRSSRGEETAWSVLFQRYSRYASDLPVIVSLEIHVCAEQQEIMVEIINESWKGMLVGGSSEKCKRLPSPAELRRKILVKVKYVAPNARKDLAPALQRARSTSSSESSDQGQLKPDVKKGKKAKKTKIIDALSSLGIYTRSYHFKSLKEPEATIPTHVFSLSEKKLMEVHQSQGPTLFSHNRDFMMRAFPSGMRISSSNLDPAVYWRKGVQMVALNWQKCDEGTMLNEAMFTGTGGWVLKPRGYRGSTGVGRIALSTESQADAIAHNMLDLSINVIAGQDIPLPIGDSRPAGLRPYVKCELHVEKPEERSGQSIEGDGLAKDGEYKRRTKTSRSTDPDFGQECLAFVGVPGVAQQLSFVRLVVSCVLPLILSCTWLPIGFHVSVNVTPVAATARSFSPVSKQSRGHLHFASGCSGVRVASPRE